MANRSGLRALAGAALRAVLLCVSAAAQPGTLPNETPARLTPTFDGFDHVRRDVMIPMGDGVRLHTVILVPKGTRRAPSSSRARPIPRARPRELRRAAARHVALRARTRSTYNRITFILE
jgi:predicted acyl esterase